MVAQARRRGINAKVAPAEALPFKDGWFERALLSLVVHVVDRPRAFAELARVLRDDGGLVIVTFDHRHFDDYYLNRYFPSIPGIDHARFPTGIELETDLRGAGFSPRTSVVQQSTTLSRETVLERLRGRFISTLQLIGAAEYSEGVERAERELPPAIEATQHLLVVVADRGA